MSEQPNKLENIIKIYRKDSLFLVKANLQTIGRKIKQRAREDIRGKKVFLSCGIPQFEFDLWIFDEDYNSKKAYELYYRATQVMDAALFGNEEAKKVVKEYDEERRFSFASCGRIIESMIRAGDKMGSSIGEIEKFLLKSRGLYGIRAIVNGKDWGDLSKDLRAQVARDYFFMTTVMENCPIKTEKDDKKEDPKDYPKLRGDQDDWGKPRIDDDDKGYDFLDPPGAEK